MRQKILQILTGFLKRKSVIFFLFLFTLYHLSFNRYTGNFLLSYIFSNYSTGSYQGKVKQFSLFYGIEIEPIEIKSNANYDYKTLFYCERLAFRYNLPYLLFGRLKLSEISFTKPFIQILERNGNYNITELFILQNSEEKKTEEESPPLEEINLYLPVSAYLNFFIEDLTFRLQKEKGEGFFITEEKNLNLKIEVNTKRFRKLPLNTSVVSIFETIHISLNPNNELNVLYEDNFNQLNQGFSSSLNLDLDSELNPPLFHSNLKLGSNQIKVLSKNKPLPPFGFNFFYELNYIPEIDTLDLNDLSIQFDNYKWLKAKGKITKTLSDEREFDIEITNSQIELLPVSYLYKSIPGLPVLDFQGNIILAPISFKGKMDSLTTKADIKIKDFLFKKENNNHSVPYFNLNGEANLNLLTDQKPTKENPIPILNSTSLKADLSYNSLLAEFQADLDKNKKINLFLNVKSLPLKSFFSKIGGRLSGKTNIEGDNFSNLSVKLNASVNGFDYFVQGSKSGYTNLDLSTNGNISFGENFSFDSTNIKTLTFKVKNPEFQDALSLNANGNLVFNPQIDININQSNLSSDLNKLIPILPLSLKEKIAPIKKILGNNPALDGKIQYKDFKESQSIDGIIKLAIPGINLNDLKSDFSLTIKKDKSAEINISKFLLSGFNNALTGSAKGSLIQKPNVENPPLGSYFPSLEVSLNLISEKQMELITGIKFDGNLGINLFLKDYLAKGKLDSKKTNFTFYSGICKENDYSNCNLVSINGINIDFPFEHDLKITTTQNLIEGNKTKYISTYGHTLPPNLSIKNVIGTHPFPNLTNELFKLVQDSENIPGLTGRLDYKENVLSLNALKVSILDGLIFGKDIIFNVGNLNIEEMEYSATIQIKDIDLKQLLPLKSRKGIKDGKIKADLNLSGKNLKDPIGNLNLFFSVFKIGEDFSKSAIRIISPPNLLTDGIISSYSQIKNIEVELSKGLVYADILFQWSILSTVFIGIDDNKISQERMPLANFLKRAQSEVSTYE